MPQNPAAITVTGLSSTFGLTSSQACWFPDYSHTKSQFSIGVEVTQSSTGTQTYSVEGTMEYIGYLSSNFNGWVSSAANWGAASTLSSAATGNPAFVTITTPFTALRLNVTGGTSVGTTTVRFIPFG